MANFFENKVIAVNYIFFVVASAKAVCTGDIMRMRTQQPTEYFQGSPSFYYHYQQHRGQPTQQIHVEFPEQPVSSSPRSTLQLFSTRSRGLDFKSPESLNPTPPAYVEDPVDDIDDRKNTSNKLYFEDHDGNATHREHHYRHVTVNHYFYNATNATQDPSLKGKDAKHHYYNQSNMAEEPNIKHHYYYNEYKHDHRNKTDPSAKHHYYYNEYKHDHRNRTNHGVRHYYHDHRNKTGEDVRQSYNTYRNISDTPKGKHYYHNDDENMKSDYDESVSEEDSTRKEDSPITDAHAIEDYEYVTPDPKPIVKHHHYFKEYHYKNGRLISNGTIAEPSKNRLYGVSENNESAKPGGFVGFPVIIKEPYDKRFSYLGGSSRLFGWPSRNKKPNPNGSLGYYLVDPLGRLPILRIHASVLGPPERTSRRFHGYVLDNPYSPEAVSYHHVPRAVLPA